MILTIEFPDDIMAALRTDADAQGKSPEQVAAERLTAIYAQIAREETATEVAAV